MVAVFLSIKYTNARDSFTSYMAWRISYQNYQLLRHWCTSGVVIQAPGRGGSEDQTCFDARPLLPHSHPWREKGAPGLQIWEIPSRILSVAPWEPLEELRLKEGDKAPLSFVGKYSQSFLKCQAILQPTRTIHYVSRGCWEPGFWIIFNNTSCIYLWQRSLTFLLVLCTMWTKSHHCFMLVHYILLTVFPKELSRLLGNWNGIHFKMYGN